MRRLRSEGQASVGKEELSRLLRTNRVKRKIENALIKVYKEPPVEFNPVFTSTPLPTTNQRKKKRTELTFRLNPIRIYTEKPETETQKNIILQKQLKQTEHIQRESSQVHIQNTLQSAKHKTLSEGDNPIFHDKHNPVDERLLKQFIGQRKENNSRSSDNSTTSSNSDSDVFESPEKTFVHNITLATATWSSVQHVCLWPC